MPQKDGTGPFGEFENCNHKQFYQRRGMNKCFGFGRKFFYGGEKWKNFEKFPEENTLSIDDKIEKVEKEIIELKKLLNKV